MTDFVRAARRAALAFILSAAIAAPAHGADSGVAAAAATEAAVTPGFESLQDVVERAIAQPAADELFSTPAPAVTVPAPAVTPAIDRNRPLAELVADYSGVDPRDQQAECLASAVYWESNGEPLAGQLAVAEVIINRARSGRFASTLCGVITQRSQFSFVRGGRIPAPPRTGAAWRNAVAIAHIALDDVADSPVSTALFFHARYVSPGWRLRRLAAVGNHIFYR
ncbi:MAG TPA: cell wall hydrolase [Allosphingosinicella sp.]|jgi:spore germination cell wall hydrolase CwlJ-like protein